MNQFLNIVFLLAILGSAAAYIDKNVYECLKDQNLTSVAQLIQDANLVPTLTGTGYHLFYFNV